MKFSSICEAIVWKFYWVHLLPERELPIDYTHTARVFRVLRNGGFSLALEKESRQMNFHFQGFLIDERCTRNVLQFIFCVFWKFSQPTSGWWHINKFRTHCWKYGRLDYIWDKPHRIISSQDTVQIWRYWAARCYYATHFTHCTVGYGSFYFLFWKWHTFIEHRVFLSGAL